MKFGSSSYMTIFKKAHAHFDCMNQFNWFCKVVTVCVCSHFTRSDETCSDKVSKNSGYSENMKKKRLSGILCS